MEHPDLVRRIIFTMALDREARDGADEMMRAIAYSLHPPGRPIECFECREIVLGLANGIDAFRHLAREHPREAWASLENGIGEVAARLIPRTYAEERRRVRSAQAVAAARLAQEARERLEAERQARPRPDGSSRRRLFGP